MKYLFTLAFLMIGCGAMEAVNQPHPFKVWGCQFENVPQLTIVLDLRGGEYNKRAIFVEHLFEQGQPPQTLPIDYEIGETTVIHYGDALGLTTRVLEYSVTETKMVIPNAAEPFQPGMGDLECFTDTESLL